MFIFSQFIGTIKLNLIYILSYVSLYYKYLKPFLCDEILYLNKK